MAPLFGRGPKAEPPELEPADGLGLLRLRWEAHRERLTSHPPADAQPAQWRSQVAALEGEVARFVAAVLEGSAVGFEPPVDDLADLVEQTHALLEAGPNAPKDLLFLLSEFLEVAGILDDAKRQRGPGR